MRERRKVKRRHLMYYTRLFNDHTGDLIGNLVDLTPRGAMVVSEIPLPIGEEFRLRMELSEDVADKSHLVFTARSLWSQPDIAPRYHNTGFEVTDIAPEDAEIIQRIIDTHGFRDG